MKLPGIALYPETERFYPNGNFASHLIGMAQKDPDTGELNGALGVEKIFNSYLNGSRGALKYIHDIWGYIAPNTKKEQQPKRGDDVHLTIDSNIQVFVEEALDDMVERYAPKDLFAVVMDAKLVKYLHIANVRLLILKQVKILAKSGRTIYIKIHMNRALLLKHTA